jgi:hypothetical protein
MLDSCVINDTTLCNNMAEFREWFRVTMCRFCPNSVVIVVMFFVVQFSFQTSCYSCLEIGLDVSNISDFLCFAIKGVECCLTKFLSCDHENFAK